MREELRELSRRLVGCKGWRWMPGMLAATPFGVGWPGFGADRLRVQSEWEAGGPCGAPDGTVPDLTDPATLGCLASLVREAWSGLVVISLGAGWWSVQTDFKDWDQDNTKSFVDALVRALEAAP